VERLSQVSKEFDDSDDVTKEVDSLDDYLEQSADCAAESAVVVLLSLVGGLVCRVLTVSIHSNPLFINCNCFWA
jgi:hypothetical protein